MSAGHTRACIVASNKGKRATFVDGCQAAARKRKASGAQARKKRGSRPGSQRENFPNNRNAGRRKTRTRQKGYGGDSPERGTSTHPGAPHFGFRSAPQLNYRGKYALVISYAPEIINAGASRRNRLRESGSGRLSPTERIEEAQNRAKKSAKKHKKKVVFCS